ncbi:5-formyltetrahydrofolate cyclo-ligase [Siminovitchia terrae]|uniref:5-formyltetrahydrofolate cyclo-ligase n=2 Tax=Siminovitchia terrae TaxID=1914933 RepID=A0ABQ4KXF4_SIMTE|nr:5-formyltetrahydrofolate cyclo-ligase [Siminovitchia terrae]GIN96359.1 5-formyltetrahydrofolate cyclo-ligase [Siminovitchia terrae]
MDKKSLRNNMSTQLKSMDRMTYEQLSYMIGSSLIETDVWKSSSTIGLTVSRFPEVDTWQLIRQGWKQGKKIVVPKCIPSTKEMSFRSISAFTELEDSFFGLFEPIESQTDEVLKSDIDLLVVPGLIYNRKGYRIGFGGGYYDRFLEGFSGQKVSLAFSKQLTEEFPFEEHDLPVDKIITEKEVIECKSNQLMNKDS